VTQQGLPGVTRRRMVRVTAARLLMSIGALGLALATLGVGREGAEDAETALYGALAAAFLVTAVFAAALPLARRLSGFGAAQLVADIAVVSALVHYSGGAGSFFSFLYVPITLYGAILFERRGAYAAALLASAGYGVALWAAEQTGTRQLFGGPLGAPLSALWVVHTVALLLVALLGTALSREVRLAGEQLAESETDLRRLRNLHERTVESLTSGLVTTDSAGRITSFNPEAERITGESESEAVGRDLDEVLPGAHGLLEGSATQRRVRRRLAYDGPRDQSRHLGLAASILRATDGSPTGHVVIFQDVTDVVKMEADLSRSERLAAAGQLAADMAHEIRNPLAAISGSIEVMREPGSDPDRNDRLMEIVLREVQRLDGLIGDFLLYARPATAEPVPVPLAHVVEEVIKMFEGARPADVDIAVRCPSHVVAMADPTQLRQVVWNLVLNAAQAMPEGGCLTLAAQRVGVSQEGAPAGRNDFEEAAAQVEITVSDTGVGIRPDVLERVFDPFFTTKRSGSGLGLPTVHRIVESHGGSLRIESELGQGTSVHIWLPAATGDEA
jgi:two-component system sensor histidine kinase PilS (NtrC family)